MNLKRKIIAYSSGVLASGSLLIWSTNVTKPKVQSSIGQQQPDSNNENLKPDSSFPNPFLPKYKTDKTYSYGLNNKNPWDDYGYTPKLNKYKWKLENVCPKNHDIRELLSLYDLYAHTETKLFEDVIDDGKDSIYKCLKD